MDSNLIDSSVAEYQAALAECGLFELQNWSTVTLVGKDRSDFLHNMCTNDIRKRGCGEGCELFLTDVKGKIVAHAFASMQEDRLTLLMVPGQAGKIVSHLDRYIIREDVQLEDETESQSWSFLAGEKCNKVFEHLAGIDSCAWQPWQNARFCSETGEGLLMRCDMPGQNAFFVCCSENHAAKFRAALCEAGAVACSDNWWTTVRVEAGLPLFGVDFTEGNLPQEVARDRQAISFTKGCYLGQETIARLDALGHVNRKLVTLQFSAKEIPQPGIQLLHEGQEVGTVTTSCWSPRLESPLALCMLRRGAFELGAMLESDCGQAKVIATPAAGA